MYEREQVIQKYFKAWINKDIHILKEIFDLEVVYSECYGPEYCGLQTIEQWFQDWQERGTVLSWNIKQYLHQNNMTAVEWYFKCEYDGNLGEFDGVSIIEFNCNNKIVNLKEFESKIPHYHPYKEC
jgi:hypothetical protein